MSASKQYGLVVAAGRGRRFGGPKQFARLAGRPLLAWSLLAFERCPLISGYVLVVGRADISRARRIASRFGLRRLLAVVTGGRKRADSVRNGLSALPERGLVAVHDAARPLVTPSMLTRGFRACRRLGPTTYAVPVTDTVKSVSHGRVQTTVPRERLYAVQTPQFSPLPQLRQALDRAARDGVSPTDDCAALELLGLHPAAIETRQPNIKVTTRADMALVRLLL